MQAFEVTIYRDPSGVVLAQHFDLSRIMIYLRSAEMLLWSASGATLEVQTKEIDSFRRAECDEAPDGGRHWAVGYQKQGNSDESQEPDL